MLNTPKIVAYKLVASSTDTSYLNQDINELLKIGWVPYGNPIVITWGEYHTRVTMYQAVVKYAEN